MPIRLAPGRRHEPRRSDLGNTGRPIPRSRATPPTVNRVPGGCVIIAGSGMRTGGRRPGGVARPTWWHGRRTISALIS